MYHFRKSGCLYINILMETTQTYNKPDLILGVNLHLALPQKTHFFETVCRTMVLVCKIRI